MIIIFLIAKELRYIVTRLLYHTATKPKLLPEQIRAIFTNTQLTEQRKAKNHSHPESAVARSGASSFLERVAKLSGYNPYFIQKSRADERNQRDGSRTYYWAKDLTSEPSYCVLPPDPMKIYIDVDYYIDMPEVLIDDFCPTALYTVQPTAVARDTDEYSYTFDKDNVLHYRVCGGGEYNHKIWNYGVDNVLATSYFWGIPYKAASYLVDRRTINTDRDLVMLTPVMKWNWWTAWLTPFIEGKILKRLNVVYGDFLRLQVHTAKGVYRSTARVSNYSSAYCTAIVDDTIAAVARLSKVDLNLPQVMAYMDGDRTSSVVLLDYHKSQTPSPLNTMYPVEHLVKTFSFKPEVYEVPKPSLHAFMQPIHHGCFSPAQGIESERQAIKGRIEEVRQPILPMTKFLSQVMLEFVDKFVPKQQFGIPVEVDEVYARQNRPSQRLIFSNAEFSKPERKIKMFLKKEAYANVKDPRPISQVNGVDKRDYSAFIYALADHLKTFPWYAFGKNPAEIATRVTEVCELAIASITGSDFSKFDGHGSNIMRELELMILLAFFRTEYHKKLIELHNAQYNLRGISREGLTYDSGYSRASGGPDTACFNSIFNAFVAYLEKRLEGLDQHQAWLALGIYGGDDGITADVCEKTYQRAAKMVGQVLTLSTVKRGELGVSFLARLYTSEVWYGSKNSCCDIRRQLSKFHTTIPGHNVSPAQKLFEKATSFSYSDLDTPIIGQFCNKVMKLAYHEKIQHCEDKEFMRLTSKWTDQFDLKDQYPNESCDDFIRVVERDLPSFDLVRFDSYVEGSNTIKDLLQLPICSIEEPVDTNKCVAVGDEVYNEKAGYSNSKTNVEPGQRTDRYEAYFADLKKQVDKAYNVHADKTIVEEFLAEKPRSEYTEQLLRKTIGKTNGEGKPPWPLLPTKTVGVSENTSLVKQSNKPNSQPPAEQQKRKNLVGNRTKTVRPNNRASPYNRLPAQVQKTGTRPVEAKSGSKRTVDGKEVRETNRNGVKSPANKQTT